MGLILELLEWRISPFCRGGWTRLGSHIQVNQLCLALCLCWKRWWQRSLQRKEKVLPTIILGTQGSVGQRHQALLSTPNGKASLPKCHFRQRKEMHFYSHHCHHPAHTQGPGEDEWMELWKNTDPPPADLVLFGENRQIQKQMPAWSLAIWSFFILHISLIQQR